jgi:N6-adenosine-specific RNA methylase IME4
MKDGDDLGWGGAPACPSPPVAYRTILADPPWDIEQQGPRGASRHYRLMTLDVICGLKVGNLCAADGHLWLWVTNASLHAGRLVMDAWGFTYRSCLTWIKPRFGLGKYLRNQTEHVLLGTKGKAPVLFHGQGTWFYAPLQEHSHKPEEQYAIIERCSPGPYLELFARRKRPGWDAWGNEVASDVTF